MALQTVKVKLPDLLYRRLERAAAITHQSLDAVLLQTIRGNLPPLLEDVPANESAELRALLKLNDDDLWAVARSSIDPKQWQRHKRLLRKSTAGTLSEREHSELERLRAETDRQVLRKSFALALLKWRGYALSPIDARANHVAA
jgi:succinate dehydrogenase flavin-adding protein (antitoxin of CptAB toxin-antitoxin module)